MTIQTHCTSGGYNLRLSVYPNGSAQIRLYDEPVGVRYEPVDDFTPNPLSGKYLINKKANNIDTSPEHKLENRQISLARTRRMIAEYARSAKWEWFCTFTFAPEKTDRTDYKKCSKKMRTWLKNLRDRKAPDLQYLAVPELHKDLESWHFHVLLANIGRLQLENSGIIKNGQQIFNIPGWRLGFSTATAVKDVFRIQKYIIKYMTKECHIMSKNAHRYFISQNLPVPEHTLLFVAKGEEFSYISNIAETLGLEVTWISHSSGYTDVTYIELEPTN